MKKVVLIVLAAALFCLIRAAFPTYPGFKESHDLKADQIFYENKMHRAGMLWLNITNSGYFGNPGWTMTDPCTQTIASSAEMPGGSDKEYLFWGALWAGGYLDSVTVKVNGVDAKVFQGPLVSTSQEGSTSWTGEMYPYALDEDPKGLTLCRVKESSNVEGKINCMFEEVYDPKATAYEQFSVMFSDKFDNFYSSDFYEKRGHIPLGIEVLQKSYEWPHRFDRKFIIIDYTIYNRNSDKKDIFDFFMGLYLDPDIKDQVKNPAGFMDDVCGFIEEWEGYIDPATGEKIPVEMNLAWTADNDGREYEFPGGVVGMYFIEPGAGSVLNGPTGVFSVKVLRNPNPNMKYSFNHYVWGIDESLDWGPHWKTGLHSDWKYDLTTVQKGYDDTNYDNLNIVFSDEFMYNGRTEGCPVQDRGRYMMMSNDEFDYNQTAIREVYLIMDQQIDGTPISQAGKWQPWIVAGDETQGQVPDGSIAELNNIANGMDTRSVLSFGPLGTETMVNLAVDTDNDSLHVPDDVLNKKVWKFAYGDSLKLTVALIVSENFHTSFDQDPNYNDTTVVDLNDGLNVSLYDQGWYDAFNNVVWTERLYDIPLFDTPVKKWGATRKDGWYGEDIGEDGIFGDLTGGSYCWWLDAAYPGPDTGEGDYELTEFSEPFYDLYGDLVTDEDGILKYGRQTETAEFGITGSLENGEGYGYMVRYQKPDGVVPQGTWVRFGYDNDRLDAGDGVPDFTAPPPPPHPKVNITTVDDEIVIEWSSHEFYTDENGNTGVSGPEQVFDTFTRLRDFEGYNIEVSDDLKNYTTIFSVDRVNYSYQNVADIEDYLDNPIPADTLISHPGDYPAMKTVRNKIYRLVPFGDNNDILQDHVKEGLYSYSCVTAESPYPEWGDIRYYKFTLQDKLIAQKKYYSVTSSDFGAARMGVEPMKSEPISNTKAIVTSKLSSDGVVVVPNPYRGDVDYRDMGWEDNDGQYVYAEEYRKIAFLNIPERCVIRIYTLAGDLCKTIAHNGYSDSDTPYWYGKNGAYWNLINENRQAVMSGIYLFSVQDVDKKNDDFVGKFVIMK